MNLFSFLAVSFVLICSVLMHVYVKKSTEQQIPDRIKLRTLLHEEVSNNSIINNKQSWDIVAAGAETSNRTIRLFYRRELIDTTHRASGANQNQPDYWNREHVWPQSYGLRGTSAARDLHNIVPTDRTINTSRSNKIFDSANEPHKECLECRVSEAAWEPPDIIKGDVARILFYMDVRYDGGEGVNDLKLSNFPDKANATFGRLDALVRWHCDDKVSNEEMYRNNVVAQAQGNRNVFIDSPHLAEEVYAFECANAY